MEPKPMTIDENDRERILYRARALERAGFFEGDPIEAAADFAAGEVRRALESETKKGGGA